eukprot:288524-Amphidinium_carterae.1
MTVQTTLHYLHGQQTLGENENVDEEGRMCNYRHSTNLRLLQSRISRTRPTATTEAHSAYDSIQTHRQKHHTENLSWQRTRKDDALQGFYQTTTIFCRIYDIGS